MYSIYEYGRMIADKVRVDAYAQAIRQSIKPDSVVLDIGSGIGIFALLACQFGAQKVYAIEPSDAIHVAKKIAKVNGFADRIEFIQDFSTKISLPRRADVIVSELRGALPLFQNHIPSIIDARERLLADNGIMIPQSDTLWMAVLESPELYNHCTAPWESNNYGLDMSPAHSILANTWSKRTIAPETVILKAQPWATLDYTKVTSPNINGKATWIVPQDRTGHGIAIWFDVELTNDIHVTNAPGNPELSIYRRSFFPWPEAVNLIHGDTVTINIRADLLGNEYIWSWDTCIYSSEDPERIKIQLKQSNFLGTPLSTTHLRKLSADHVPLRGLDAEIDRYILLSMNGKTSLGDIAYKIMERFPSSFSQWRQALARVSELSDKYSK